MVLKYLIFAPHPDDEIIGCGGYLAKLIAKGNDVNIAYLTTPEKERVKEIEQVKKFMGFNNLHFLNQGKGRSLNKSENLLKILLNLIRESSPSVIILPHANEQDTDHSFLNQAAMECYSYLSGSNFLLDPEQKPVSIDTILGYEIWTPIISPALFINITDFMGKKKQAMELYTSQNAYKNFISMFEGLNQYRGVVSGIGKFVEAFEVYKIPESEISEE